MKQTRIRHSKQLLSIMLVLCLVCTLCGCSQEPEPEEQPNEDPGKVTSEITITDMIGRSVTIPANVETVYSATPASEAWLAALCPEKMIGWANKMTDEQLAYYPETVSDLPLIAGWYGYHEGNAEGIITMAPDVIIYAVENEDSKPEKADELQDKMGIPVICVTYDLNDVAEVMRNLGIWLGNEERGNELADYIEKTMMMVADCVGKVPESEKRTVYYAEDVSGLMTEAPDSFHAAVLSYCNLKNVADVSMSSFMGREEVSLEQVINWNPEYIFVFVDSAYERIKADGEWADIKAVKDGNVYRIPCWPQNWYDRSPNMLRMLGCLYTATISYPEYCDYDLDAELSQFFQLFYDRTLTLTQIHALYK